MAKPIPRRRGGTVTNDAPDADAYASRSRRSAEPDKPEEERRPRRGRGELPSAAKDDGPPAGSRRARAQARDAEPKGDSYPASVKELDVLNDQSYDDLLDEFEIDPDLDGDDQMDALWDAIQATRVPKITAAPSRRGRPAESDEPWEDTPAFGGRRSKPEDDKPRRGRSNREEPDDDSGEFGDEPPRRTASKGFKGYEKTRAATSSYADDFKLSEEEVLVKFLDDEPFATYGEHGLYKELNDGQRVWVCLAPDESCAICDTGHRARAVALWNIVVVPEEGKPELKVLKAGPALEKVIEQKAGLKSGPMGREYYSLRQTPGKNDGPPVYAVEVIRERELEDEWSFKPFTDDALDDWLDKAYDETFVKFPSEKQVKDVARKLRDED